LTPPFARAQAVTTTTLLVTSTTVPSAASTTVYYIGAFDGMLPPQDDAACGPAPSPCATLSYWTANRRDVLVGGDTVRLAPGIYAASEPTTC